VSGSTLGDELLKFVELIRALDGAHNAVIDLEELSEAELDQIHRH
jgi:hypothetical protein